jgi:hypothetical protein
MPMAADPKTADLEPGEASRRRAPWINKVRFRRAPEQRLSDKLLTTLTILLSILVFVVAPLQASGVVTGRYFGLIFGAVLTPAAFMLAANRIAAGSIVISIILLVGASEVEIGQASRIDTFLDATAWIIAGVTLSAVVARAVFAPGKVTFHRIIGGILLYLTIGLTFVPLFGLLALFVPEAFRGLESQPQGNFAIVGNLIYFSFVTLTTIGYGDIVPLHPYARGLANFEAVIGQLYPATLLARLVSLQITSRSEP